MAKKNQGSVAEQAGAVPSAAADTSMADFLSGLGGEFAVGSRLTLNIWEPKVGEIRAFVFEGMETKTSERGEFAGSTFDIHYGRDLKTGEDFSFIGGGLFSFTLRDRKIDKGTPIIARYMGMVDIEEGTRRAKQWEIRKLEKKDSK